MKRFVDRLGGALLGMAVALTASAQTPLPATWTGPEGGGNWETDANWDTLVHPNGVGAHAVFNDNNQVASRTFTLPVTARTVGAMTINSNLGLGTNFSAGTFRWDATDAGPVRIVAQGVGTGQATISSSMIFMDDILFDIQNRVGNASVGALTVNGNVIAGSSVGGLIKEGPGTMTFAVTGGSTKSYLGATIIREGRFRHSLGGIPSATSSVTVEPGGQLHLISGGVHTYGASASTLLTLNGFGRGAYAEIPGSPEVPALAASPGALLVQAAGSGPTTPTIANLLHLASDSSVSVRNSSTLALSNVVSGPGRLHLAAGSDDATDGTLLLTAANTYGGGTRVAAGTLQLSGVTARAGVGDLIVAADPAYPLATARAEILTAGGNAISDGATLILAGGGAVGIADQSFLMLGAGVNETVGGLILGGVAQTTAGTYGSGSSLATFKLDEFFAGAGVVTLAPANDADFDNDGDVDGGDFLVWQRHFGSTSATSATGDATGDGAVTGADLAAWRAAFGTHAAPALSVVPEPSTVGLLAALALCLIGRARQANRSPS